MRCRALWSTAVSMTVVVGFRPGLAVPMSDEESHCVQEVRPEGSWGADSERGSFVVNHKTESVTYWSS